MTRTPSRGRPPPRCTAAIRWPSTRTSPSKGAAPLPSKIVVLAMSVLSMPASSACRHRVADHQFGHRHAGAKARHELIRVVLDADRVFLEGRRAEPVLSLLGRGEVVDLELDAIAVGIAVVHGGRGTVIDAAEGHDALLLESHVVVEVRAHVGVGEGDVVQARRLVGIYEPAGQ